MNISGTSTYQFEHVDVNTKIVSTDEDPIVTDLFIYATFDNSKDILDQPIIDCLPHKFCPNIFRQFKILSTRILHKMVFVSFNTTDMGVAHILRKINR